MKKNIKKALSLILAVLMLFSSVPASVMAAEENLPMIRSYTVYADFTADYHYYKADVVTFTFLDKIDYSAIASAMASWDVSAAQDGSVMAWINVNQEATAAAGKNRYDVWVAGEGGVAANTNSSNLFYGFVNLVEINGLEFLDTSNVTSMAYFFEECNSIKTLDLRSFDVSNVTSFLYFFSGCRSLESVNFTGWDTSSATNMGFMFANCLVIPVIDISSFDTSNVTYMKRMFYKCEKLHTLYTSDGWSLESVTDSGEMFNCCYVIPDKQNHTIGNNELPAPYDGQYANTTTGFLTYKALEETKEYTVTYVFDGDVPSDVTVPSALKYNEGSKVELADVPSVEGYVFEGWTTDAEIDADGKITVDKDIVVTGTWTKLYDVTYKYIKQGDTEIPSDAPKLPVTVSYKAGDIVDVAALPFVEGYVFEGWDTDDTDFADGKFSMPANDVEIYGYFKIPVEEVVINGTEDPVIFDKNEGGSHKIDVYVTPDNATFKGIVFESSDEDVATVTPDGVIVPGNKEGEATITVYAKDDPTKSDTITVIVKVPVTDITTDKEYVNLDKGETSTITGTVVPEDATNKKVIYESSDESVVTVDENGNIVAVGKGEATITVKSEDNPFAVKEIPVTVRIPVTEIKAEDKVEIEEGKDLELDVEVNEGAEKEDLIYESTDKSVITVDNEGNIVGVGEGEATIIITSKDNPEVKKEVTVTVYKNYKVTYEIIGDVKPENVTTPEMKIYKTGETVTVEPKLNVEGYTFSGWSTENDIDLKDGKFEIYGDVHFVGSFSKVIDKIVVEETEITLRPGEKDEIKVTVEPENGVEKKVTYKSSDEDIVKVDENGNIEAIKPGTATITINSEDDNGITTTVTVTVIVPVEKIEAEDVEIKEGESQKITVTFTPDDTTNKDVTFYSKDEKVATVDKDGNITAVGEGTTTIVVTSQDDPLKTTEIQVTVYKNYKVTYEFIGEVQPENVLAPEMKTYKTGETVIVEADASAEGYVFSGWSTENNIEITDGKFEIYEDVHFTGSWKKLYKVEYVYEGEVPAGAPKYATETFLEGSAVTVYPQPKVEGYTFVGWTTDDVNTTGGNFTMPDGDVIFCGYFKKNVTGVVVDKTDVKIEEGETDKITVTVNPEDASDKTVTYKSSDEKVVKVDENGNIEATGEGEATITITSNDDPSKTVEVKVTVYKNYKVTYVYTGDVPADATDLPHEETFKTGEIVTVKADASAKGYTFSGWDTEDATVVDGKFVIRNDVVLYGSFTKIPVEDITVGNTELKYVIGDTDKIEVTVTPDNALEKSVTYESSDENVVKVDEKGNIEAVGEGTATITVTSKDNPEIKEVITVTVKTPDPEKIPVEDIIVENTDFEYEIGEKDELKVTVTPDDATEKGVTYKSSDETVIKVDENGNIEAVGEGEATITITSKDNSKIKEVITVTVKAPETDEPEVPDEPDEPTYTFVVPELFSLYVNETANLGVVITPDDGKIKPVYTSADESIVKVDADGNLTGIAAGITTISVDFGGGDIRVIPVTVLALPTIPRTHYVCFGKTDGIGWYEVSVNGGDFFAQGPNSTLEVEEGSVLVVRVQDMWIDDEFDFYVNGSKVPMDAANTITVVVDGYMLIGALSMDVEVPDVDESVSFLDKIASFFSKVINWFKDLFTGWFK